VSNSACFAYAQARLQARHGMRPTEQLWRRLASTGDLANFLQQAQRTALRPWVLGMQATQTTHALELALRQRFRNYVDEVASWLPGNWSAVVRPVQRLPDLPALQYLLHGEAAPEWLLEDPGLRPFAAANLASRLEVMQGSDCAFLVLAWQHGEPLYQAWLEQWQDQWRRSRRFAAGLASLSGLLHQYLEACRGGQATASGLSRRKLVSGLNRTFRRYSFEPAAACAHLGLVALDLEKLRGELLQRALFSDTAGGRA
jgi:hypothetical protein